MANNEFQWSNEQRHAIDDHGKNILVSAGAGSGKTTVLTERIGVMIENGYKNGDLSVINKILAITFTNNAAREMKERVKTRIKESRVIDETSKKDILNKFSTCQITTFDSFALFLVKKYHNIIGVGNGVKIIDEAVLNSKKREILNDILDEYYKAKDPRLMEIISDFTNGKSDKDIIKWILDIDKYFEKYANKKEKICNYVNDYFSNEMFEEYINRYYLEIIKPIKDKIKKTDFEELKNCFIGGQYEQYVSEKKVDALLNSNDYESVYESVCDNRFVKIELSKKGKDYHSKEDKTNATNIKNNINKKLEEINKKLILNKKEISDAFEESKKTAELLLEIEDKLNNKVDKYKKEKDQYIFADIFRMALELLSKHEEIREEVRNSFVEVMIDEYQDTNDQQEEFIELIGNNNVYVVGDIKQAIYEFRNSNTKLFANRYDKFIQDPKKGGVIKLTDNHRSRKEIVEDTVNSIFLKIMDKNIGGENYEENKMTIKNNNHYPVKLNDPEYYGTELYIYEYEEKQERYKKSEIEAFIIANDIKKKYNSEFKIKKEKSETEFRSVRYDDFCILMQTSSDFELYKKIFTSMNIPVVIERKENLTKGNLLKVIKSIFDLISDVEEKKDYNALKFDYVSVARSFLIKDDINNDDRIYQSIIDNRIYETEIMKNIIEIVDGIQDKTITMILDEVIDKFDVYNKIMTIGDIDENYSKLEYLYKLAESFNENGQNYKEFSDYCGDILNKRSFDDKDGKIEFDIRKDKSNAVKIMTIHGSKGLQFNICYYPQMYKSFEKASRLGYNSLVNCGDNGISMPVLIPEKGVTSTINKDLNIIDNNRKTISEKIRLFYVALTRAKEKIVIVCPKFERSGGNYEGVIPNEIREKWDSFVDMIKDTDIKVKDCFDRNKLLEIYSDKYKLSSKRVFDGLNPIQDNLIQIKKLVPIEPKTIDEGHFSKSTNNVISSDQKENMDRGTKLHSYFEEINFENPNYTNITCKKDRDLVENFVNKLIEKDVANAKVYKEQEFIVVEDGQEKHGIIDLLLEYEDKFVIIDYKTKNIDDKKYDEQVNGYRRYIESIKDKPVECYLYSIMQSQFRKVEKE